MPVINFSMGDFMRNKILEKGWVPLQIAVTGPSTNKAKDGFNYTVTFTVIDSAEMDGKEIQRIYSSKAIGMMIPLVAASRGKTVDQLMKETGGNMAFDVEELNGKKIDGLIDTDTYEGNLKNICEVYLPYKTSSNEVPY